jgi:hypothetical protein
VAINDPLYAFAKFCDSPGEPGVSAAALSPRMARPPAVMIAVPTCGHNWEDPPGGCAGCVLHLPIVGGIVRHMWGVSAWGSGVSATQHLTREEGDRVPTDPLSRRVAAMGRGPARDGLRDGHHHPLR